MAKTVLCEGKRMLESDDQRGRLPPQRNPAGRYGLIQRGTQGEADNDVNDQFATGSA